MRSVHCNSASVFFFLCAVMTALILEAPKGYAQSVPAELIDLSLDDLLAIEIKEDDLTGSSSATPWTFSYSYHTATFNDYLDGTRKVPLQVVLFSPGEEPRTDKNFPVVPEVIQQEAHSLVLSYQFSQASSVTLAVPYIRQSTDHISIVPGYSEFNISSSGLGDVSLVGNFRFRRSVSGHWQAGLGISFPTGSIDEEGDTPRAAGNQQLPYTMQHGSGTYDVPAYIAYHGNTYAFEWGAGMAGKFRLGQNDRGYTLGNRISASTWLRVTTLGYFQPSVKFSYRYLESIDGGDDALSVPGPFPYPAPVTDPELFGGQVAQIALSLRVLLKSPHRHFDLEVGKPIYQNLNGPQSSEDYRIAALISFDF